MSVPAVVFVDSRGEFYTCGGAVNVSRKHMTGKV